ncbi:NOT2 family protein-like protein [Calycina marina]|uniref:NOT2 family protein-like protein n=1 Tax=Calycina marina TaxID=1763456 RepID=A0A9P8CKE1_9HELO|nr:NOT2 family protein-like protein [Calycina marina]
MNRPGGTGAQSLRGLPNGFPTQQQLPQNRSVVNRLPAGKLGNNSTWAFGGAVPMGSAGLNQRHMTSFAQTLGGRPSQPTAPLDLSFDRNFPSLGHQAQSSPAPWGPSHPPSNENNPPTGPYIQPTQVPASSTYETIGNVAGGQEFRYGRAETAVLHATQGSTPDDSPASNHGNGEIGGDRPTSNVPKPSSVIDYTGSLNVPQPSSGTNGLLSAIGIKSSANDRVTSPVVKQSLTAPTNPVGSSQKSGTTATSQRYASGPQTHQPNANDSAPMDERTTANSARDNETNQQSEKSKPEFFDPLAGMSELDRWGLKGFTTLMSNYPSYAALVCGRDLSNMGFDLTSSEPFATMEYSLFDNEPARQPVPYHQLPDCYTVHNVAPIDTKIANFNDEALMMMFYSNPNDVEQQELAAAELNSRNWRYHKKMKVWLCKDPDMQPRQLNQGSEHGFYIFFNINTWERERREFTLAYEDLAGS